MRTFQFHLLRLCIFIGVMIIGGIMSLSDNTIMNIMLAFLGAGLMDLFCNNSFTFHMDPGERVLLGKDKKYGLEISAQIIDGETLGGIVLKKQ